MKRSVAETALCAIAGCALLSFAAYGNSTNLWTGAVNDYDWNEAGNFRDGLPAAGDIVQISNAVVRIDASTESGAASIAKINTLEKVWPLDVNAVLEVTVDGEATISMPFTAYPNSNKIVGELRKKGPGTLNLTSKAIPYGSAIGGYHSHLHVVEGSLKLPRDTESAVQMGRVTVDAGAYFYPYSCKSGATPNTWATCGLSWKELWGAGTITNDYPTANSVYYIRPNGSTYCEFSGDISRQFRFFTSGGNWALTGTNSLTATEIPVITANYGGGPDYGQGILSVAKIGNGGARSSIGPHNYMVNFRGNGGCLRYLGKGENSNKHVTWQQKGTNDEYYWNFIDGGPHGALNISGMFQGYQNGSKTMPQIMERIMLTGSNAAPCIVSGSILLNYLPNDPNVSQAFFGKQGSGTWRFADTADTNRTTRPFGTPFTVEGGTLQFDSLREVGEFCSLGMGNMLLEPFSGSQSEGTPVDWFFALGRTNRNHAVPAIEYSGLGKWGRGVTVASRKILLKGSGRISNASSKRFRLAGVSAAAGGDEEIKYLHLGGANETGDEVLDISDGPGRTGIVKDGLGTWALGGDLTFTGPVDVREGTLRINAVSSRYTWFKFIIKEILGNNDIFTPGTKHTASEFILGHLAVYDSEGTDLTAGKITTDLDATRTFSSTIDWTELEPGYVATGYSDGWSLPSGSSSGYATNQRECNQLFLTAEGNYGRATRGRGANGNGAINLADTSSWHSVVFRLPDSVTENVAAWDAFQVKGSQSSDSNRAVTAYAFLASPDGIHWDMITDGAEVPGVMLETSKHWLSQQKKGFNLTGHTTGFTMSGARATEFTVAPLSVKVAPGAHFVAGGERPVSIRAIEIDAAGGGTIDGFTFAAENGSLDVTGYVKAPSALKIPVTFTNASNLQNVAAWSLTFDGQADASRRFTVSSDGITVTPVGTMLIVR